LNEIRFHSTNVRDEVLDDQGVAGTVKLVGRRMECGDVGDNICGELNMSHLTLGA
jgi:hypothetical protein